VFTREPTPGAAETGEDLVGDEEPALLVAQVAQVGQEPIRRDALTPAALNRLDEHGAYRLAAGAGSPLRRRALDGERQAAAAHVCDTPPAV